MVATAMAAAVKEAAAKEAAKEAAAGEVVGWEREMAVTATAAEVRVAVEMATEEEGERVAAVMATEEVAKQAGGRT